MRYIEKLFYLLFPLTYLKATPWESTWNELEKSDFLKTMRFFFSIVLFGYIAHYYTVDVAEGLAPSTLWFNYRYGMASIALAALIFYSIPTLYNKIRFYRLVAISAITVFCYFQARTCIWYPKVPYLYSFAFVMIGTVVLRASASKSVLIAIAMSTAIYPTLIQSGVSNAMVSSGIFFSLCVIMFTRSKYTADLRYFILTQKNLDQQKQIIEINMEFTNQIKSFLPREISKRLVECIQKRKMGVNQAVHQVLKPKKQEVACLFSDIRGFTKNSNDLNGFVAESMFPEVIDCTNAIENSGGISRKVGDLLFSYYDNPDIDVAISNAIQSAISISQINRRFNQNTDASLRIKRFILISYGEAIVGNLSGFSSSIEITAIGSPVNLLSRIDEITKKNEVSHLFESGDIVMCENLAGRFQEKKSNGSLIKFELNAYNLKIRDFEKIETLYIYRTNSNEQTLSEHQREAA